MANYTIHLDKLIICVLAIVAAAVLTYAGKVSSEAGVGLIMAVLGYVFGNAHGLMLNRKGV